MDPRSLEDVGRVVEAGLPSFKIYMAYGLRLTDAEMLLALETPARHGGLPVVHSENHDVIRWLAQRHRLAGHTEPRWHPHVHPAIAEAEATGRALALAKVVGLPMRVVHVRRSWGSTPCAAHAAVAGR